MSKRDQNLADLGYIKMYLEHLKLEPDKGGGELNRKRAIELCETIRARLQPSQMNGRAWTDTRKVKAIQLAQRTDLFRDAKLTIGKLDELYQIVCADNENWDGEEVSVDHIVKLMTNHYARFGVRSSIP